MTRDLTMIVAVLVSVVSVGFGMYKNFESRNNHAFIYEQAYQIINQIQKADIAPQAKAGLIGSALGILGTPVPVVDFSQSSAAPTDAPVCSVEKKNECSSLAAQLAAANAACVKSKGVADDCSLAVRIRSNILTRSCIMCFSQ